MNFPFEFKETQLIWQQYCSFVDSKHVKELRATYQKLTAFFQHTGSLDEIVSIAVLEKKFLTIISTTCHNEGLLQTVKKCSDRWLHCFKTVCPEQELTVPKALKWINDNNIEDESLLYDLAARCAKKNPTESAEHFDEFRLKSVKKRYRFAKKIAETSGIACSIRIRNFNLPQYHSKLVLYAAKSHPSGTANCIKNYTLDEDQIYATALQICNSNPKAMAENFDNFQIPCETKRFKLAGEMAAVNGEAVIANFGKFKLVTPQYAAEIAISAFQQNPIGCVKHIGELDFLSERTRFELLITAINIDPIKALRWVQDAKITNPDYLFELAKLTAVKNSSVMLHKVVQWSIQGEDRNFILAKICAETEPLLTAIHIKDFQLNDPSHRKAILHICARLGGPRVLNHLSKFEVSNDFQLEAAAAAIKVSPVEFFGVVDKLNFSQLNKEKLSNLAVYHLFITLLDRRDSVVHQGLKDGIPAPLEKNLWLKRILEDKEIKEQPAWLTEKNDPKEKKHLRQWWFSLQGALESLQKASRHPSLEAQFNSAMKSCPNQLLRSKLTIQFLKLLQAQDDRVSKLTHLIKKFNNPRLNALSLYLVESNLTAKELENVLSVIQNQGFFKEDAKNQLFLFTLDVIVNDLELTQEERINLLTLFWSKENYLHDQGQDRITQTMIRLNELILYGYLDKIKTIKNYHDLEKAYLEAFEKRFNYYHATEDFAENYRKRFEQFSLRNDIFLLARRFSTLPPLEMKRAQQALRVFLGNWVNGTLKFFRYNATSNEHLKKIFSYRSDVEELWRQNHAFSASSLSKTSADEWVVEETDDPQDLLQLGSIGSNRLGVSDDPNWSQCILGNWLDGKYKAIVVKSQNKVIGGCLLRLMYNEVDNQPLIFREKIETSKHVPEVEALIKSIAQKCRKRMNIPLVSVGLDGQIGLTAKSFGGVYYKECVDCLLTREPVSNPYNITHCTVELS